MRDAENMHFTGIRRKFEVNGNETDGKCARYEPQISFQGLRKTCQPEYPKFASFKKPEIADDGELETTGVSHGQRPAEEKVEFLELGVSQRSKKESIFCIDSLATLTEHEFEMLTGLPNIDTFWQFYSLLDCDKICPNMVYCTLHGEKSISRCAVYGSKHLATSVSTLKKQKQAGHTSFLNYLQFCWALYFASDASIFDYCQNL